MKYKKVLKPKKTLRDDLGEWEVVEQQRESYLVEKPVYTDSEEDEDDSESDWSIQILLYLKKTNQFKQSPKSNHFIANLI